MKNGMLGSQFNPRENSFGFLRLLLATGVLFSHCYILGSFGPQPLLGFSHNELTLGSLCVLCFFVLSGFLITRSRAEGNSSIAFLWHRFLRIFPGFWVCLLITTIIFAPIYCFLERHSLVEFYSTHQQSFLSYLKLNAGLHIGQWGIPPLLQSVPYPGVINGSIWSLYFEWHCYLRVLLLGFILQLPLRAVWISLYTLATWGAYIADQQPSSGFGVLYHLIFRHLGGDQTSRQLGAYFAMGSFFYLYRHRIPNHLGLFCLSTIAVILGLHFHVLGYLGPPALTYSLLWLAFNLPRKLAWFDKVGDVSYGLYIYAFPIQQALALGGAPRLGLTAYVILSMAITLGLAILSYKFIEAPALKAKRYDPTFGLESKVRSLIVTR